MSLEKKQPIERDNLLELVDALAGRVKALELSRDYLKKELIRLIAESDKLQKRQVTTLQFYEFRLDQICHNLMNSIPGFSGENPARNGGGISYIETNPEWEKLVFSAQPDYLEPGVIKSPLTLSGFRLNTGFAAERLKYVEIFADVSGIALFGPYKKIVPGTYEVLFNFEASKKEIPQLLIEVVTVFDSTDVIISRVEYSGKSPMARLKFEWPLKLQDREAEFRIHQLGGGSIQLSSIEIVSL